MIEVNTSSSYGVYRIISPNGSCYVGMTTKSFDERWSAHRKSFRLGSMVCIGLRRAFEKYGEEAMTFEIVEDLTGYGDSWVLHRERTWWLRYRAWGVKLYNGEPTGNGAVRHTEETRMKISKSLRERTPPKKLICELESCSKLFEARRKRQFCSSDCLRVFKGTANRRKHILSDLELRALYLDEGLSKQKIADIMGVHRNTIGNMLLDYDIPRRKIGRGASK